MIMSSFGGKLLIGCLLICFGVFYGIDVASNGIEQVNGPMTPVNSQQETVTREDIQPSTNFIKNQNTDQTQSHTHTHFQEVDSLSPSDAILTPVVSDKLIHRLADKTGEVIQSTFHFGVEIIVSVFDDVVN